MLEDDSGIERQNEYSRFRFRKAHVGKCEETNVNTHD